MNTSAPISESLFTFQNRPPHLFFLLLTGFLFNFLGAVSDVAQALLEFDDQINLVLTDYFMPELDGVGLTSELRNQGYQGPIIGVTAATIGDQMNQLLDAGADLAIAKPLTRESFIAALNSVVYKL
ncbi:MAG: response regulator [Oceanospirillaceae bacterium]|nr:response regulator [Oceanospirillaceae bacterium]